MKKQRSTSKAIQRANNKNKYQNTFKYKEKKQDIIDDLINLKHPEINFKSLIRVQLIERRSDFQKHQLRMNFISIPDITNH